MIILDTYTVHQINSVIITCKLDLVSASIKCENTQLYKIMHHFLSTLSIYIDCTVVAKLS